jgi:Ca2+-binding RTX toxin-like protein
MTLGLNAENVGISNITGGSAADAIDASNYSSATTITGDAGNDFIFGGAAADSLLGGTGADSILGGADNDTLLGDAGNDTIFGDAGNDSILGGADADSLIAGTGTDTLLGEAGNDTLVADATGTASLLGGDDSDSFLFTSGAQVLANTVVGGAGTDTLVLTATSTVTDAQLVNVSGEEAIQASSLTGNSITLGTNVHAGLGIPCSPAMGDTEIACLARSQENAGNTGHTCETSRPLEVALQVESFGRSLGNCSPIVQRPCFASILNGSKGNGDGGIVSLPQTCA